MTAAETRKNLSERDRAILIQAYKDLVTVEFLHQRHFKDQAASTVHSEIQRLCRASLLYSLPLGRKLRYYRLTRYGARAIGVHPRHTRALKQQGLVNRFALSWFFNIHELDRSTRFDPGKHYKICPELAHRRYWRRPFFLRDEQKQQSATFGIALVDHGASSTRLARKLIDLLAELIEREWIDIQQPQRRLIFSLLTHTQGREETLQQAIDQAMFKYLPRAWKAKTASCPLTIELHVVPGLDDVLLYKQINK